MDDDKVRRPIRLADFAVVAAGLAYNVAQAVEVAFSELLEIATYNAIRKSEEARVWSNISQDLETLSEDTDGA